MQCPDCGGTNLKKRSQSHGVARWKCGSQRRNEPPKGGCGWNGTRPIGIEKRESLGVPRKHADKLHRSMKEARGIRRYVITSAQNATPIWEPFFEALKSYCKHRRAQLVVIPYRYKNPTAIWSAKAQNDDWWASELVKHLLDRRIDLNKNLMLLADIKTQPTAANPLEGFETISGDKSAIIGHPKLELISVPTPQNRLPKLLTTTGTVTRKNYIPSKAGKKGEFHHTFGACVVELSGDLFHMRQINATKDGSFCELAYEYRHDAPPKKIEAAGLVMGDTHVEFVDPDVVTATWGQGSITEAMKPAQIVWHDAHDCYSVNPHHKDLITRYTKHHSGKANASAELRRTFKFIDDHTLPGTKNIFPFSNHPGWLARWVNTVDPRTDLENIVFWAETFKAMTLGEFEPFSYWAKHWLDTISQARFLAPDESHAIAGIEVGMHGHLGPNGSRGTIDSFGKVGTKSVIGHSHSPGIKNGVYQVGTSSRLRLDYNRGPSSWLHTHCLIYPNGKRTLINVIDGKWRA